MSILIDFFIVIGQKYGRTRYSGHSVVPDGASTVRVTKNKPDVAAHEIALAMSLQLPESLFKKPSLSAKVVIPDADSSYDISASVQAAIAAAVKEQTGIVLHISAPEVSP